MQTMRFIYRPLQRRRWLVLFLGLWQAAATATSALPPVSVDFFYEPGCRECEQVKRDTLPLLDLRYGGLVHLREFDVGIQSNYVRLVAWQEQLGMQANEPVSVVVAGRYGLSGTAEIQAELLPSVDLVLSEPLGGEYLTQDAERPETTAAPEVAGEDVVRARARALTWPVVLGNGLLDGLNPCAIATLVFFMSVLAVSKVRGSALLAMGAAFCAASFVTYTAIGFGLLRVLHLLDGLELVRRVLHVSLSLLLLLMAGLSWRDACRYHRHGNPSEVTLQLPDKTKRLIHRLLRRGVGARHLAPAGFVLGAAVTALESVCTGQMYVPTLVFMIASGGGTARIWGYLLAYNLMFIVPIVVVFGLTYAGLQVQTLLKWNRKHVVISKCLLGLMFVVLAVLFLIL